MTSQSWSIQTRALAKSFGDYLVLNGIDLEVRRGESVVIFGPNGAGKTTLIKVLAGMMSPTSGSILVDGLSLKDDAEEIRRRIGVVTHRTFLYPNLTAYENLEFYSRLFDLPRRRERIYEVVAMMGMTARLHDRVATLSRGMQQRLSIARALLHKPHIMLLDEPETGLDQEAMPMLWQALKIEGGEEGTIILTTHNLERGLEVGERLLILVHGKIAYEGSKQTLNLAELKEVYQQSTET